MNRLAIYGNGAAAQAITRLLCENGIGVSLICPRGVSKMESAIYTAFVKSATEKTGNTFQVSDDSKVERVKVEQRMSQLRFGDNFWALDEAPEIVFEIFDDDDVAQKRRAVTDVRVACAESVIASHSEHRRFDEIFTNLLPLDRRLIGTRFAYPIGDRKAIEIFPTSWTGDDALTAIKSLAIELNMNAILCQEDSEGVIARNRFIASLCEAKEATNPDYQAKTIYTTATAFESRLL